MIRINNLNIIWVLIIAIQGLSACSGPSGSFPAPVLGVTVDKDFLVLDVKDDSAAEQAGIQKDDILLRLNGQSDLSPDEWQVNLGNMELGQEYEVTVQRGNEIITLEVISKRDPPAQIAPGTTPTSIPTDLYYF